MRATAAAVVTALAMPAAPLKADERVIRCESRNYRYQYCRADTDNRASLVTQISTVSRCELGRTWGYDHRGVWVDRGCAGEFRVGRSSGGGGRAAAATVAGALIVGAIIASQNKDRHRDEVPSWAVGTFRGYDSRERTDIEVRITPSGSVDGFADGNRFTGGWTRDRLELSTYRFRVTRAGNGFNATDERDSAHQIYFTPSGWGR
jgi:hypothetical protein